MTAIGSWIAWLSLAVVSAGDASFVESVQATMTDGLLVVDVKADGEVEPGFASTKRSGSWFTVYVEGLRVRPDNRAWSNEAQNAVPVTAHRHARRIELKMRLPDGAACGDAARVRFTEGVLRVELPCGANSALPDVPVAALPTVREATYHAPAPEPVADTPPATATVTATPPAPAPMTATPPAPAQVMAVAEAPAPVATTPAAEPTAKTAAAPSPVTATREVAPIPQPTPAIITQPTRSNGIGWGYALLSAVLLLGGVGLLFREPIALRFREWTADGGVTTLFHPIATRMGKSHINIIEKKTISPNRVLVLAEIDGERILLADTEAGLELLSPNPDPEPLVIKTPPVVLTATSDGQEIPAVKPTPPERLALEKQVLDVLFGSNVAAGGKR